MNLIQQEAIQELAARYNTDVDLGTFITYPADSFMMSLWAEGWIGTAIYVGVDPEGRIHS